MENTRSTPSIRTPRNWKEFLNPLKIATIVNAIIFLPISIAAFYIGNPFEYISGKYGGNILFYFITIFSIYFASAASFSFCRILKSFNLSLLWSIIPSVLLFLVTSGILFFGLIVLMVMGVFGGIS
ncbi:MAG: hypothetical protein Q7T37_01885 [bacterium]|nr:hypothetical protein [bacterium]MDO8742413.1 hypothetical protein [bacterium]